MNLREVNSDIFLAPYDSIFVQCISADFAMGKGIAIQFNKRFDTKKKILERYETENTFNNGYCIYDGNRVYCLVTKDKYWQKPTYDSLKESLIDFRDNWLLKYYYPDQPIVIASPKIGCGLDKLNWDKIRKLIIDTFANMNNVSWNVYYI